MQLTPDYRPEFESLARLLLEIAAERSTERLSNTVVQRLAARPYVALAALWLLEPGDICATCPRRSACADQTRCLHLVANARNPVESGQAEVWNRVTEQFGRVPLGFNELGQVAATGEPFVTGLKAWEPSGMGDRAWAAQAGIAGVDAQPIVFNRQTLGVVALLSHIPTPSQGPTWVRIFADHIATAIVNARAFEENERLKHRLELENSYLQEEVKEAKALVGIIGQSAALKRMLRQVEKVARTDATVLILGESGTGKELVAREIHQRSRRSQRPLIRVNCASIPRELYESEFFGHVKGAFTGALRDRAGRFEAADGGTLFLDEVGEIPLDLQSKFLRVLQEKQYERVGEEKTRTVDVRIIAATNRNLKNDIAAGRFRQDLYYRLNVFPITVAPLRERSDDIPLLAVHFVETASRRLNLPMARLTPAQLAQLQSYDWPGNVRELQNTLERALILAQNELLTLDLPTGKVENSPAVTPAVRPPSGPVLMDAEIRRLENDNIVAALNESHWKIHGPKGAAELLGLKPTTLISRLKRLGLTKPPAKAAPG